MIRAAQQASWKGTSCRRHRQQQYYSWLVIGSAPRMALIWATRATAPTSGRTNEPDEVHLLGTTLEVAVVWVCLRHFQLRFSSPWLLATVTYTRVQIQEREQWGDNNFEQFDEMRDAWLTIPCVYFEMIDVQKALWCWAS